MLRISKKVYISRLKEQDYSLTTKFAFYGSVVSVKNDFKHFPQQVPMLKFVLQWGPFWISDPHEL